MRKIIILRTIQFNLQTNVYKKKENKMNEIITANGVKYTVQNLNTGLNTISFMVQGLTVEDAEAAFRNVASLTVGTIGTDETEDIIYGEYPNVIYESITKDAEDNITITLHIPTKNELQIAELQESQAEQDEAIATIMFGGELQ
jgi:CRISPR/Cas system type I-B associated protein Csh2 (Cas7 group RAMP superfamily)